MSLKIISPSIVYLGSAKAPSSSGSGEQPQLYDTRILSSASAPEGWAYTCSNAYRTFSSSTLPTLYNDINTKLQNGTAYTDNYIVSTDNYNCDLVDLNFQNIKDTPLVSATNILLKCNNNYYTSGYDTDNGLYIYDNNSWTKVQNSPNIICAATNTEGTFIICVDDETAIYKFNPSNNTFIQLANSSIFENPGSGGHTNIAHKEFNNNFYFYPNYNSAGLISNHIYETPANPTVSTLIDHTFNKKIVDIVYNNNYWYVLVNKTNEHNTNIGFEVYKGSSLSNSDFSDATKWELIYSPTINNIDNSIDHALYITVLSNRFIIFYATDNANNTIDDFNYIYTDDEFNTINSITNMPISTYCEITTLDNVILICGENTLYYCDVLKINNVNNWQTQTIGTTIVNFSYPINNTVYLTVLFDDQNNNIDYVAYSLNISAIKQSILINYHKYENFKICQYSDLTLLNQLYTQYGISNYWNIYNNAVSIPVDSQQYKIMYVGDNFNDDLYNS